MIDQGSEGNRDRAHINGVARKSVTDKNGQKFATRGVQFHMTAKLEKVHPSYLRRRAAARVIAMMQTFDCGHARVHHGEQESIVQGGYLN